MTTITFVRRNPAIEHSIAWTAPDEAAWLPVLGPTAFLLGQLMSVELRDAEQTEWVPETLASRLGVGTGGHRRKPLANALERLTHFGIVYVRDGAYVMKADWGIPPARRHEPHTAERG